MARGRSWRRAAVAGLLALALAVGWSAIGPAAQAQVQPQVAQGEGSLGARLRPLLRLDELDAIIVMEMAATARADAGPGQRQFLSAWERASAEVLSADRIGRLVSVALDRRLEKVDPAEVWSAIAFAASPFGQRVTELQLSARRMMTDPVAADAAGAAFDIAAARSDPRADRIRRLVAADGLAEASVAYAMTNTLAFLAGMDRGVPGSVGTEDERIAHVWAQEAEQRAMQAGWAETMLFLALAPLSDSEIEALARHVASPASRRWDGMIEASYGDAMALIMNEMGASVERILGETRL